MDPFSKLPLELLFEILTHVEREDIPQAIKASSALSEAEYSCRNSISRRHTLRDLFGGSNILQDAMALLTFPTFTVDDIHAHTEHEPSDLEQDLQLPLPIGVPANGRTAATDVHLKTWAAGGFSDPFLARDSETIANLDRLCRHIWLFASDYLSKATQEHLPTAYDQLPSWAVYNTSQGEQSTSLASTYTPSPLSQLTPRQRSRLLQAFIQYELLCKVFRPIAGSKYIREFSTCGCRRPPKAWKAPQLGPFRRWRWDLLHIYQGRTATIEELHMLTSVREYIVCTFARLTTGRLSRPLIAQGNQQGVPFLLSQEDDNYRHFEVYNIRAELKATRHGEELDSALATCGLGTLSQCLQLTPRSLDRFTVALSHDLRRDRQLPEPTGMKGMIVDSDKAPWHAGIMIRLVRQRAMEVLRGDDGSARPLLMSPDDKWKIYAKQLFNRNGELLAPLGQPLVFPEDSTEGIVHGCHRAYESLTGMLKDLWEQPLPGEEGRRYIRWIAPQSGQLVKPSPKAKI